MSSGLPPLSSEQQKVIDEIKEGRSVELNAVAGSGKTTTALSVANNLPDKSVLLLTYNSKLRMETVARTRRLNLQNLTVHTYHSTAVNYYDDSDFTDVNIKAIIDNDLNIKVNFNYDIVIIDEAQDMTKLYFLFVCKLLKDLNIWESCAIMVMGDVKQCIYGFKGADSRYLRLASEIYQRPFTSLSLSVSYRLTTPMQKFLTHNMPGGPKINTVKDGCPVQYIRANHFEFTRIVLENINVLLDAGEGYPSDIFILAGSLRISSTTKLINKLSRYYLCYVQTNEAYDLDDDDMKNKIVISTFHQSKGRERKIVFVHGFDDNYFTFLARDSDPELCPNTIYVASTRATSYLYLLDSGNTFRFLDMNSNLQNIDEHGIRYYSDLESDNPENYMSMLDCNENEIDYNHAYISDEISTSVTKLIRFTSVEIYEGIKDNFTTLFEASQELKLTTKLEIREYTKENISNIHGIIIPYLFFINNSDNPNHYIKSHIISNMYDINDKGEIVEKGIIKSNVSDLDFYKIRNALMQEDLNSYLIQGVVYSCTTDKIFSQWYNLFKHNRKPENLNLWLSENELNQYFDRMKPYFSANIDIEKECYYTFPEGEINDKSVTIRGSIDVYDIENKTIWEIKCVQSLSDDHYLQLMLYAFLLSKKEGFDFDNTNFKLFNIMTGEIKVLEVNIDMINDLVYNLVSENINRTSDNLSDQEFIDINIM